MVVPSLHNHVLSPVQWIRVIRVYLMAAKRSGSEADRSLAAVQTLKRTTDLYLLTLRILVSLPNKIPEQHSVHCLVSSTVLQRMSTFTIRNFIFFMLLLIWKILCLTAMGELIAKDNFSA